MKSSNDTPEVPMNTEVKVIRTWTDEKGKQWETITETCDRCGGRGLFAVAVHNGQPKWAQPDAGVCYKCHGEGHVHTDRRVLTEKEKAARERAHARKEVRRLAKVEARAEIIRDEVAEKLADEADDLLFELECLDRIAARKAISQFQGTIGEKITVTVTMKNFINIETRFGSKTIVIMEDEAKNVFKWFTSSSTFEAQIGDTVAIIGTVKEHEEYNGRKETVLIRCKKA
jgi:RNA 3'-terminal phosphate cyclase